MKENNKNTLTIRELDVIGLTKKVLAEKKLLVYFILVFAVIGIIYAFNQQKRYTSTVSMAPEASGMGMSESLSDLAGMVGINLDGNSGTVDAIYPEIYPEVLASTRFLVNLFGIQVKQSDDNIYKSYYDHIKFDTKVPFWDYPKIMLQEFFTCLLSKETESTGSSKIDPTHLTKEQNDICGIMSNNIGCQINKGTNIIYISVEDVDPVISAEIADTIQKRLQEYIIQYRTQKARIDLEYSLTLAKKAEAEYQKAQRNYASYSDSHTNSKLVAYQSKISALENDMDLKYTTLSHALAKVEQAKAKIQERTPAFTVIQEACVPLKPSSTPRSFMVFGFMILGCITDALWVLFLRDFFNKHIKRN